MALKDFLARVRSIERTIDLREQLVVYGQAPSRGLHPTATRLRRSVRRIGLSGMQPSLDGDVLLLVAAFEQFVTDLIVAFAARLPHIVPIYDDLPSAVQSANERLTGEALSNSRSRFAVYDLKRFIDNLRDCQAGVVPYVLNGEAMALNRRNLTPGTLKELFSRLGVDDIWAMAGATRVLKSWSGRGGAKAAQSRAKTQINELIETRNQIAHRVVRTTAGPELIRSHMRFERALARSLVKGLEHYADSLSNSP